MALERQTILVTGGDSGIGLAVVRHLSANGADVIAAGRAEQPRSVLPGNARYLRLDVTREADWAAALDDIVARYGAVNGLVNNAGILGPGTDFLETTLAHWRQTMAVNLDGAFLGCRLAMAAMAQTGGGTIVNMSSGAAHIVVPSAGAYGVSKAAVLALTRLAAKAGAGSNVRVNAVLPGAIDTPMLWSNLGPGQAPDDLIALLARQHPIGRIGQPIDIARAVAFLIDPENSFVTGALLAVDGGQLVD